MTDFKLLVYHCYVSIIFRVSSVICTSANKVLFLEFGDTRLSPEYVTEVVRAKQSDIIRTPWAYFLLSSYINPSIAEGAHFLNNYCY